MNTQKPISAYTLKALVEKLRPDRFPGMPGKMAAVTGFILGADFIHPAITQITVKTDGSVMVRLDGYGETKRFIGSYRSLLRHWQELIGAAGLSNRELMEAQSLFASRIGFFGRANA